MFDCQFFLFRLQAFLYPNVNITKPSVTVLPPSPKELCNALKNNKGTVTLVCLANAFYPDHVSFIWQVNGKERNHSVATDHVAQQDPETKLYSMSSRLHVNHNEWTNVKNKFTCIIQFYNRYEYDMILDTITFSPDKIPVRVFATVQFGYLLFLSKSLLYAVFVSFLVWKSKTAKSKLLMTETEEIMIS